jgi:hypothetical protein
MASINKGENVTVTGRTTLPSKNGKISVALAANGVNNSISANFLMQAARILEGQGNKAEALKIYQVVKAKYLN